MTGTGPEDGRYSVAFRVVSDDGHPVMSAGIMRHALEYALASGRPVIAYGAWRGARIVCVV